MKTIATSKITSADFFAILRRELNCNHEKADRVFKAILQTIKDGMPSHKFEAICCHLPSWIKNVYCKEIKTTDSVIPVKDLKSFYLEVVRKEGRRSHYDFLTEAEFISSVKAVLRVLGIFLTIKDIKELTIILPEEFNLNIF